MLPQTIPLPKTSRHRHLAKIRMELSLVSQHPAITIRPATPEDKPQLVAMGEEANMGTLEGFETTLVACVEDSLVGFCRLRIFNEIAYVNPIVISKHTRNMGVGSALMRTANMQYGELRLISRGYAVPFYRSLGCREIPWSRICNEVANDCAECSNFNECAPLPMFMPANTAEIAMA